MRRERDSFRTYGIVLTDAVPMNRGSVCGSCQRVGDVNDDRVAPVGEQGWARDGPVDGLRSARDSIGRHRHIGQLEPVLARDARVGDCLIVVG